MQAIDLKKINKVHFIGIGGIGMSGLARLFFSQGKKVTGSDLEDSALITDLKKEGISVKIGHKENNLPLDTDLVVFTEAIPENNVELKKAQQEKKSILTFFQALGLVSKDYFTIAICGSHGKTTTTAMTALNLIAGGLDPTVIVGTKMKEFGNRNERIGRSKYLVVEACEYRRSFLYLEPSLIVITNIDVDHLDYYKDDNDYRLAFAQFVQKLPKNGILILNDDDPETKKLLPEIKDLEIIKWGNKNNQQLELDYWLENKKIWSPKGKIGELELKIPGKHNLWNALASFIVGDKLGIERKKILSSLNNFAGTWRRFEFIGKKDGIEIYDDYAHHPTEIKATLTAAREKFGKRRICLVYQPHQYNRTKNLLKEFGGAFFEADLVIVPNIYKVRDKKEDTEAVSAETLVAEINKVSQNAIFGDGFDHTVQILKDQLKSGDILMTMGAGDVWKIGEKLRF